MVIYKYKLDFGVTTLLLHEGAQFLSAALQGKDFYVWCLIDSSKLMKQYEVLHQTTGMQLFGEGWNYIQTVHVESEKYVGHFFYRAKQ